MGRRKKSPDDPTALTEYIGANVTKNDVALITCVMEQLGVSKADAIRMLLRAGARSTRWASFTPQEEDE